MTMTNEDVAAAMGWLRQQRQLELLQPFRSYGFVVSELISPEERDAVYAAIALLGGCAVSGGCRRSDESTASVQRFVCSGEVTRTIRDIYWRDRNVIIYTPNDIVRHLAALLELVTPHE